MPQHDIKSPESCGQTVSVFGVRHCFDGNSAHKDTLLSKKKLQHVMQTRPNWLDIPSVFANSFHITESKYSWARRKWFMERIRGHIPIKLGLELKRCISKVSVSAQLSQNAK